MNISCKKSIQKVKLNVAGKIKQGAKFCWFNKINIFRMVQLNKKVAY